MPYTHLSPFERYHVERRRQGGASIRAMARELNRSPSTIARELKRNTSNSIKYKAINAQQCYIGNRKRSARPAILATRGPLRKYVTAKLREKWSPEQIANALPRDFPRDAAMRISHESIYAFVYADKRAKGDLYRGFDKAIANAKGAPTRTRNEGSFRGE